MAYKEFRDWREDAECVKHPEVTFVEAPMSREQIRAAKAICRNCVVIDECLDYALETNQSIGVWGGQDETERKKLRRRWLAQHRSA